MELQRDQLSPLVVSDSPVEKFREFLEIRGEKLTERRRLLVEHIFNSHKHFDADELVRDLHEAGHRVSRATVYRTLRLLVEAGLLRELRLTNRSAFEHDYGYPAHDHLHCTVVQPGRGVPQRRDPQAARRDQRGPWVPAQRTSLPDHGRLRGVQPIAHAAPPTGPDLMLIRGGWGSVIRGSRARPGAAR